MKSFFLILIILIPLRSESQSLPLYEFGVATALITTPDYPAADQSRTRNFTIPTFIYRGLIFKSDRRGTRASLFNDKGLEIDLSFGASLPANSEDNDAREAMDDLDWIAEIGPRLSYIFFDDDNHSLIFSNPVRFAFSTDAKFTRERGYRYNPEIDYRKRLSQLFRLSFGYEINYCSEALCDYFYQVTSSDVTQDRQRYNAKGGLVGDAISSNIIYRARNLTGVLGIKYNRYHGAANENSPLYKVRNGTTVFMALNYFFYQSKESGTKPIGID